MTVDRPFLDRRPALGALALTGVVAGVPLTMAQAQPATEAKMVATPVTKPAKPVVAPPVVRELPLPPIMWRALPQPSNRPMAEGPAFFVDAAKGDDTAGGSQKAPWKTLAHATAQLKPGDTLYLRGGTYFERLTLGLAGTPDKPITIRSFPGELAIVDNGYREFEESPATCWEPAADGVPGEYVSTKAYPDLGTTAGRRGVNVLGRLLGNMVPLQGYKFLTDLRSKNEYWSGTDNMNNTWSVYVGPGLWLDPGTKKIHVRLAPLTIEQYGDRRIDIGSDPRKLPMIVAGGGSAIALEKASNLRLQDIVLRGAFDATVRVNASQDITLDGVSVYAGTQAVNLTGSKRVTITNSVLRGLSAPWSTRASHKYRGNSPYLLACGYNNADFEFSYSEFTDSHDGLYIGNVPNMKFHHNIVENFDDDGIYLNADATGSPIYIYQNRFARILSNFSFSSKAPLRNGAYIFRNIIDQRQATMSGPPTKPEDKTLFLRLGRLGGDHGDALWQPMYVYQNTVLVGDAGFRGYYAAGWGWSFANSKRRVFNNIVIQENDLPGLNFDTYGKVAKVEDDFQANNNLLWSIAEGPKVEGDFFAKYRQSAEYKKTVEIHAPGWTTGDLFADPKLKAIKPGLPATLDVTPQPGSPAIDAGLTIPKEWPDPLRDTDKGKPDIGALPLGTPMWPLGPQRPTK